MKTIAGDTITECIGHGLTKREHFAAMAMQGLLADSSIKDDINKICEISVKYSDALINALNK